MIYSAHTDTNLIIIYVIVEWITHSYMYMYSVYEPPPQAAKLLSMQMWLAVLCNVLYGDQVKLLVAIAWLNLERGSKGEGDS